MSRIAGLAEDITVRKRALARAELQHAVTRLLAESTGSAEVQERLLAAWGGGLHWEYGEFWSLDRGEKALHCARVWHAASPGLEAFAAEAGELAPADRIRLVDRVWTSGRPITCGGAAGEPDCPVREIAGRAGLKMWVGIPIALPERKLGVVTFFSTQAEQRTKNCSPSSRPWETSSRNGWSGSS